MTDGKWVERRSERIRITLKARCNAADNTESGVVLVNVTPEGCCMLTGGAMLIRGTAVLIRLANGEALSGTVRWCDAEKAGVEFGQPLPAARVAKLRREQSTFLSETNQDQLGVRRSVL